MRFVALSLFSLAVALYLPGCDTNGDDDNNGDGPLTVCKYSYTVSNASAGDYGTRCTSNADCKYGVCFKPSDDGNLTNTQFSFCTRGCDCDNAEAAKLTDEEKVNYFCLYPGCMFSGQSQGAWRHVVPRCNSVADCTAIDPSYNKCANPGCGTLSACIAE